MLYGVSGVAGRYCSPWGTGLREGTKRPGPTATNRLLECCSAPNERGFETASEKTLTASIVEPKCGSEPAIAATAMQNLSTRTVRDARRQNSTFAPHLK